MDAQATRCVFHKRFRCSISSGVSEIGMMVIWGSSGNEGVGRWRVLQRSYWLVEYGDAELRVLPN